MVVISVAAGSALALHAIRRQVDRLVAQLRELARTDPLTGLANRREFESHFETELSRARRSGAPFALALGDLDHFKRLNDAYGHGCGDDALRAVGRVLTESTRTTDLCARVGGEEFAIILPETAVDGALPVLDRVRARLAAVATPSGEPLSISFGLVEFPGDGGSMRELMHAGDMALYGAKELGRDRVCLAADTPS
jgi:diguanylate cyclase (GGDEF)-like protein